MTHQYPRPRSRNVQSRVTNGKALLAGIDGRSKWARRLHDLVANHIAELGGPSEVTQSQFLLVKSAANLTIAMEQLELEFAKEGAANFAAMIGYQTLLNSLRRVFESLGLERKQNTNSPPMETYDLTNLNEDERKRVRLLAAEHTEVGANALGLTKLRELMRLLAKAKGYGYGPSNTDRTPRQRPYHDIDWDNA